MRVFFKVLSKILGCKIQKEVVEMMCYVLLCLLRWRSACRAASSPAWSWKWPIRATRTRTGWRPSSPHAASCFCCASAATATTARPTSGAMSWRPSCTRWAGAPRTTRLWCPPKVGRDPLIEHEAVSLYSCLPRFDHKKQIRYQAESLISARSHWK